MNVESIYKVTKNESVDLPNVPEKDKDSIVKNLYSFPSGKKLSYPMTVLYVDWNNSTEINEKYSHNALEHYYRVYCKSVSWICNKHKEVRYVDFQGDGVLIFIPGKGNKYLDIAEEIKEDISELVDLMNEDPNMGINDLSVKSAYDDGDVTISKVGRSSKNSKKFQNLVFVGTLVSDVVKSAA